MKRSPMKRTPIKAKKTSTKALINKCDRAWGLVVRLRDKDTCQKCGKKGNNPHHLFSRSIKHMRHDPDNGITLCVWCHVWGLESAHKGPEAFRDWLIRYLEGKGRSFEALKFRAAGIEKPDYETTLAKLEEVLRRFDLTKPL